MSVEKQKQTKRDTNVSPFIESLQAIPVMNEVLNILKEKKFTDPGVPIQSGETVVGTLSPLVRAALEFINRSEKKLDEYNFVSSTGTICLSIQIMPRECLSKFSSEMTFCPYVDSLKAFKAEHPFFDQMEYVENFIKALLEEQIPDGEKVIANHDVVTTKPLDGPVPAYKTYDGWETMTLEQLVAISIEGTVLETIAKTLASKRFRKLPLPVAEAGEVVLRNMTGLERAMATIVFQLCQRLDKKIEQRDVLYHAGNFEVIFKTEIKSSTSPFGSFLDELFGGSFGGSFVLDMTAAKKPTYLPKDKTHKDYIKTELLTKDINTVSRRIDLLEDIHWSLIDMNVPEEKMGILNGIRMGEDNTLIAFYQEPEE